MRKALFTICLTLLLSVAIHAQNVAPPIYEQNAYSLRNGDVFYYDELLEHAHYPTFRILGHGLTGRRRSRMCSGLIWIPHGSVMITGMGNWGV